MKNIHGILYFLLFLSFGISSCDENNEDCTETSWYQDADGDSLGNPDITIIACEQPTGYVSNSNDQDDTNADTITIIDVDPSHFLTDENDFTISIVDCTLSDGTSAMCYEIVTSVGPSDHEMGPWCPDNITDGADKGGIWLEGGEVYDVDGAFIENMANFYDDDTWRMYDADGNIYTTDTEEDCANAANPNVGAEYENFCVECLPSYVAGLSRTYLIPSTPVLLDSPESFGIMGPPGQGSDAPTTRGIAFNGIHFDAPAPTDAILGAYTLAPFDDAGGHINLAVGYHYHAATGLSKEIIQNDNHAPMIGYAMDGHAIFARLDSNGNEPDDLDSCRGHYDEVRGYHYHVDKAGSNNFINCMGGAYAIQ